MTIRDHPDEATLDRIAQLVGLDDDGGWCDESGKLESIAMALMATGRIVRGFNDHDTARGSM